MSQCSRILDASCIVGDKKKKAQKTEIKATMTCYIDSSE